ncbi:YdcF family protein [Amphritea sp. 1_MG-2023]|uniref:YdcF family protein n=1 Tax=Amphritea sp. 1_MG-2023 TaxID=3062670 RepID=UPI0026E35416|nr:YdcF family protein [Amphritea sp. 1_MG-2023]MDO6563253.1 YdcF family protein [Amphritea sp. 1_MG-2023]
MDLFFLLSKGFWVLANPGNLLVILLLIGLLKGWRTLSSLVAVCLLLITLYPVGDVLLQPLEKRFSPATMPQEIAGIVVLGGAEEAELSHLWQQPQFNMAAERDMAMLSLLQRYPEAPVILTGGSGTVLKPEFRGADVQRTWLKSLQLEQRVIFERDSRNTFENAIYSQDAIPTGIDAADPRGWLLVTSAFHMPRSVGVFRQQGWHITPYPVDYYSRAIALSSWRADLGRNLYELSIGVREWIGLAAYYMTDKTDTLFPAANLDMSQHE